MWNIKNYVFIDLTHTLLKNQFVYKENLFGIKENVVFGGKKKHISTKRKDISYYQN